MPLRLPYRLLACLSLLAATLTGCHHDPIAPLDPPKPDYNRELPPGSFGLRMLSPGEWPDINPMLAQLDDPGFFEAAGRSAKWFGYRSTKQYFPTGPISHGHARASVYAMTKIAQMPVAEREAAVRDNFDMWTSVGWDGSGTVLFTGYFSPIFTASKTRTGAFQYPLYQRPTDLVSDAASGQILGRSVAGSVLPYPSRIQIEQDPASLGLAGKELVWLPSELDAYLIQVNGSAKLNMTDGSVMTIGYAGTNGHDYVSIGKLMSQDGVMPPEQISLATIRQYFAQNPDRLAYYVNQNPRYVFFQHYDGKDWPAGSLGFKVTPMRSLATDKSLFPRGCVTYVTTTLPSSAGRRPFNQLMLDQDTGGAIRAPGRSDIYIGIGPEAEDVAGRQAAEGRLYYPLLKREQIQHWYDMMTAQPVALAY